MKGIVEDRVVMLGNYIIENKATVRAAAKKYGVSKSTVHKDVSERIRSFLCWSKKFSKLIKQNVILEVVLPQSRNMNLPDEKNNVVFKKVILYKILQTYITKWTSSLVNIN